MTESEVTGTQGMGGSFGVGAARIGDSSTSTAKSKRDGKGNVQLDLTQRDDVDQPEEAGQEVAVHGRRRARGRDKKKPTGLLSDAAGGGGRRRHRRQGPGPAARQPGRPGEDRGDRQGRRQPLDRCGGDQPQVVRAVARARQEDRRRRVRARRRRRRARPLRRRRQVEPHADPRPAAPAERRHLDGGAGEPSATARRSCRSRSPSWSSPPAKRGSRPRRRATARPRPTRRRRSSSTRSTSSTPTFRARTPTRSSAACRRRCCSAINERKTARAGDAAQEWPASSRTPTSSRR